MSFRSNQFQEVLSESSLDKKFQVPHFGVFREQQSFPRTTRERYIDLKVWKGAPSELSVGHKPPGPPYVFAVSSPHGPHPPWPPSVPSVQRHIGGAEELLALPLGQLWRQGLQKLVHLLETQQAILVEIQLLAGRCRIAWAPPQKNGSWWNPIFGLVMNYCSMIVGG